VVEVHCNDLWSELRSSVVANSTTEFRDLARVLRGGPDDAPGVRARHSTARKLHVRVAEVPHRHPKVPAETAAAGRSRVPVLRRGAEVPGRSGVRDARPGVEHLFSAAQFLKSPSYDRPQCGRPNRAKSSSLSDARPISAHPKGADALRSHASLPREGRAARVCRPDPGSGRTACRGRWNSPARDHGDS